jgi:hypothetical protein
MAAFHQLQTPSIFLSYSTPNVRQVFIWEQVADAL